MSQLRMSRAVVLERFGAPLSVREFAVTAPPAGGMVVACHYGGICGTDLHLRLGHLPVPTPLVLGHEVVVVGGPASRLRQAAECGIGDHHVDIVGTGEPERALDEVRELTGGAGADLVIECAGVPRAVAQGLRLARRGGSYLVIGQYADSGDVEVNPHQIVYRQLDVRGSWAFSGAHLVEYVRLLPTLVRRFDLGRLVTAYPLEDHASAMAAVAGGAVMKAVFAAGAPGGSRTR